MNNGGERRRKKDCNIIQGIINRLPVGLRKHTQNFNQDDVTSATRTGSIQNKTQKLQRLN
jgi:hypothetical protein